MFDSKIRFLVITLQLLICGCASDCGNCDTNDAQMFPVKTDEGAYWVEYRNFIIQTQFDAVLANWGDAETQCESNNTRLPTSNEWAIVFADGFGLVARPFYAEWFKDIDGKVGVVSVRGKLSYGTKFDFYTAFRCSKSNN